MNLDSINGCIDNGHMQIKRYYDGYVKSTICRDSVVADEANLLSVLYVNILWKPVMDYFAQSIFSIFHSWKWQHYIQQ